MRLSLLIQIHKQCAAFRNGLFDLLHPEWLQMFDQQELQVLISGGKPPCHADVPGYSEGLYRRTEAAAAQFHH
ncbi:hypothetical protein DPMN_105449 [Dreissena polymorpha]|uniref:HECT-type E3 ubiquitin transferase n=1 Tax=Dreissena polymorpha TaxID=45954 RepID=A0A9D4H9J2_DREPO|nr:hypothetical protein DPMN_105449 [Dreissena polymorpha]